MNTRILFLLAAAALALPASAQVYKCKTPTGGTLVSDRPCDGANKTVDVRRSEPVTLEQQMQAAEVQQRRRQQLGQMQAEESAYRARLAAREALRAEQEAIQAENAQNNARQQKCDETVQQMQNVKRLKDGQRAALAACGVHVPERERPPPPPVPVPAPAPAPAAPGMMTNCDPAGCWDTSGNRYNKAGGSGNFHRQDGRFCRQVGNQLQCD